MKLTNKRLVSILLCLAMVLAMLPMAVFAEATYTVAGEAGLCGAGWDPAQNAMTANENGTYSITFTNIAAGTYQFKVTNGTWNVNWGDDTASGNYEVTLSAAGDVTVCFDPANNAISVAGATVSKDYHLVGSMTSWNAGEATKMEKQADGTFKKAITVEKAGNYEYKINDGAWKHSWGTNGQNIAFAVPADNTEVTVTFDPATAKITAEGASEVEKEPMVIDAVYAVGAGSGNFLYGQEWVVNSAFNKMNVEDGVYSITYMGVQAGTYDYKFAANGAWDINWSFGEVTESGVSYDAWFNNTNNSQVVVEKDNSTVTLTLDLSAMDYITGEGAKMSAVVVAPAVSAAPEALVLGSNNYSIAAGDTNAVSSTYIVEKDGILSVSVSAMTTPEGEVPAAYIPMQFGRQYALLVNGEQVWLPCEIEVAEGDEVEIGVMSYMGNETSCTIDLAIADPVVPGADQIKWQITAGTNAESESTSLRFVSYVDSLDYSKVIFNVTYGGETETIECKTAYSAIIAAGVEINDVTSVFGENAAYFITASMTVPAEAFDGEISVTVTRVALDGTETTSEARSIVVSDAFV